MVPEPLPTWLNTYCDKIGKLGVFDGSIPNHVLVNEYTAGQGIMPHLDGSLYFPTVSTITLGSHTVLNFYEPLEKESSTTNEESEESTSTSSFESRFVTSLLLEPRSLVLVKDLMYTKYLHGITETTCDIMSEHVANLTSTNYNTGDVLKRATRVSLTIRVVPKVMKAKLGLLFGKKK